MPGIKRPDISWGDLKAVEQWHRAEKDAKMKQKLNAIRLLMKGHGQQEVADAIGVSVATIRNWRTNWDRSGKEGLQAKHKGSRSRVSPEIRAEIEQVIEIKREIDGRTVTGKLIVGYLKKNTN